MIDEKLAREALQWLMGTHPAITKSTNVIERIDKAETCLSSAIRGRRGRNPINSTDYEKWASVELIKQYMKQQKG